MSTKDIKKNTPNEKDSEEMVSFVEGASIIDMAELRRAQANLDFLLDEDAGSIRTEIENDPELKKDVLADYDHAESNEHLDRIASRVKEQEQEEILEMEELTNSTSEDLLALNEVFIAEDKLLEGKMAQETIEEAAKMAGAHSFKVDSLDVLDLDDSSDSAMIEEEMSEEDSSLRASLPHPDENGTYDLEDLKSCIEALLFYSDRPVSLKKLKGMLEMEAAEDAPLIQAIGQIKLSFQSPAHGFELAEIAGGYQLRTKHSKAPLLRKLAKVQVQRLSRGAMETLTLVCYKQPCTKDDIDQVRGVDSSHFIRTLLDRKLIEVSGRSEAAGRPMIYSTTDTFLEVFNLMDLKDLPPLHEIEAMVPQMSALQEGEEDPRVIQMRSMVHQMKVEANHLDYDTKEDEKILQEIRDRVKSIDINTPYMTRQKQLAEEGVSGEDADAILAREFGFERNNGQNTVQNMESQPDLNP